MRPEMIVVLSPGFDLGARVIERHEPARVEALVAKAAVKRFDERVVGGLARTGEIERDAVLVGPAIERQRYEFWSVVRLDTNRSPSPPDHLVEQGHDVVSL